MRHEQCAIGILEQMARDAADDEFGQPRMAPGTHDQQIGAGRTRGGQ